MRGSPPEPDEPREIDLRLAVGAVAAWLAVLVGLALSVRVALVGGISAGGLAVAAVLCLVLRHRFGLDEEDSRSGRTLAPAALALLCVAIALFSLAAQLHRARDGPLAQLAQRRAAGVIEATVRDDPRTVGGPAALGAARVAVDVTVTGVRSGSASFRLRVPAVVLAAAEGWRDLVPGQRIRLDGRLTVPRPRDGLVGAVVTARGRPVLAGRPPWWQRAGERVRTDLRTASRGLPPAERGLLPGLVDGDTSGLDPVIEEEFRVAGLTHLIAVSGTNCAIVVGAVLLVLRRLGTRRWLCALIGGLTLVAFVVIARPSPSVVRAAVMASIVLLALAAGRPRQGVPALATATLVLLVWRPDWARSPGFAMSVLATAALLIVAPQWAHALRRRGVPAGVAEGVAVSTAATLVTAPVAVLVSGRVSLVAIPANLIAELAVAPATVLGVLAATTAPLSLPVGAFFAELAGWPGRWLVSTAAFFGTRSGASIAWPRSVAGSIALAVVAVLLVLCIRARRLRLPIVAALLAFVIIQIPVRSLTTDWPVKGALLVACDVGQGDGLVIPVDGDAAVVVDSGPEPVAIDRCLRSLGVHRVLVYVQSHFDLDHVGGLAGVVRGRALGLVLTGPLQGPPLGRGVMDRALASTGVRSQIAPAGTVVQAGRVRLDVLASHIVDVDGVPDSNNSSLVVRASVAGHRILLLGDAATPAQQYLLAAGIDVRADVLKVAHHGSRYFDPDLYAAVGAQVAVISVGAHNTYGHPSPEVLRTLADLGVPVERTDQDGDIAIVAGANDELRVVVHHHSVTATGSRLNTHMDPISRRVLSAGRATMGAWARRPTSPAMWPTAGSSWSSATRSISSIGPSSRSPPPACGPTRRPRSSDSTASRCRPPSSMKC